MFNVRLFSRRRNRQSFETREKRQNRFVIVAIFIGLLLAIAFGLILYTINVSGRI